MLCDVFFFQKQSTQLTAIVVLLLFCSGPVGASELRDAAEALKRAVKPLRTPDTLAPDAMKDDTENTNTKALTFLGLAKAKVCLFCVK